jgi:hypothetical protein
MIKYRYAKDEIGTIIDVNSLERSTVTGKYFCMGCSKELLPRLGKIRRKHFAHKHQLECSPETYLHRLGKHFFYNIYKDCLLNNKPYLLEYEQEQICNFFQNKYGVVCNRPTTVKEFDLTQYFTEIELEKRDGTLIPDVRLFNPVSKESIYIEIAVTHRVDENKEQKGNRIIEFLIKEEDDLELVKTNNIPFHCEKIARYNFEVKSELESCEGKCCSEEGQIFVVYQSGRSVLLQKDYTEIEKIRNYEDVIYFKPLNKRKDVYRYSPHKFRNNVVEAYKKEITIKNCFLCRYHALSPNPFSEKPVFCKFQKFSCDSNQAIECEYFRPDKQVYSKYLFNQH